MRVQQIYIVESIRFFILDNDVNNNEQQIVCKYFPNSLRSQRVCPAFDNSRGAVPRSVLTSAERSVINAF